MNSNRTNKLQTLVGTSGPLVRSEGYSYDAIDQITAVAYATNSMPMRNVSYQYDSVGNRQQVTEDGNPTGYTPNNLNQYTLVDGSSLTYDNNGNLWTTVGGILGSWSYTYDAQNRLLSAISASTTTTFAYDARNRFYSPLVGRFLQIDPIGFEAGDVNLYTYTGGNPILRLDAYGLDFSSWSGIGYGHPNVPSNGNTWRGSWTSTGSVLSRGFSFFPGGFGFECGVDTVKLGRCCQDYAYIGAGVGFGYSILSGQLGKVNNVLKWDDYKGPFVSVGAGAGLLSGAYAVTPDVSWLPSIGKYFEADSAAESGSIGVTVGKGIGKNGRYGASATLRYYWKLGPPYVCE